MYTESILGFAVSFALAYRVWTKFKRTRKRFTVQIFGVFTVLAILPSLFMFLASIAFFNSGINNFFRTPVNNVVTNSLAISEVYINSLKNSLYEYIEALASHLYKKERLEILEILKNEMINEKVNFILFETVNSRINVIYQSPFSSDLQSILILKSLETLPLNQKEVYETEGYIVSVRNFADNLFLAVTFRIDEKILTHRDCIETANKQYMKLSSEKLKIKLGYFSIFSSISIVVILLALFAGLTCSKKITIPVNKFINAIQNIRDENYKTFILLKKQNNEWDNLVETFNNMVSAINNSREKLAILSKQSAWKDIARKMAHEIKNPLTPILLSAERLRHKYNKEMIVSPETFNGCINTIIKQVNNINNLVKEFSDFARLPEPKLELNDLVKLLDEIVLMYENSYPDIVFLRRFENKDFVFKFDIVQMNQAFINVIINAIHSITENVLNEQKSSILITCELNGNDVSITIEDDGIGFSCAVLNRALEPYYTTRKNGTGLGLAIVHKVMNDHCGKIVLENSQVLRGAKVTLALPYCK